jgi:hypothetical protein
MPVSLYDLSMIVIINAAIQLTGLAFIMVVAVRGFRDMKRGHDELKRLDITIGGLVYQEDEKTRALITARFDEIMRQLPR